MWSTFNTYFQLIPLLISPWWLPGSFGQVGWTCMEHRMGKFWREVHLDPRECGEGEVLQNSGDWHSPSGLIAKERWGIGQIASPIWTQFHLQNELRAGEGSPSFHAHNSKCAYFLKADMVSLLFVSPCPPESGFFGRSGGRLRMIWSWTPLPVFPTQDSPICTLSFTNAMLV